MEDSDSDDAERMSEPRGQTPFERFEQLTRALVKVPKSEIDAERGRRKPRGTPRTS